MCNLLLAEMLPGALLNLANTVSLSSHKSTEKIFVRGCGKLKHHQYALIWVHPANAEARIQTQQGDLIDNTSLLATHL